MRQRRRRSRRARTPRRSPHRGCGPYWPVSWDCTKRKRTIKEPDRVPTTTRPITNHPTTPTALKQSPTMLSRDQWPPPRTVLNHPLRLTDPDRPLITRVFQSNRHTQEAQTKTSHDAKTSDDKTHTVKQARPQAARHVIRHTNPMRTKTIRHTSGTTPRKTTPPSRARTSRAMLTDRNRMRLRRSTIPRQRVAVRSRMHLTSRTMHGRRTSRMIRRARRLTIGTTRRRKTNQTTRAVRTSRKSRVDLTSSTTHRKRTSRTKRRTNRLTIGTTKRRKTDRTTRADKDKSPEVGWSPQVARSSRHKPHDKKDKPSHDHDDKTHDKRSDEDHEDRETSKAHHDRKPLTRRRARTSPRSRRCSRRRKPRGIRIESPLMRNSPKLITIEALLTIRRPKGILIECPLPKVSHDRAATDADKISGTSTLGGDCGRPACSISMKSATTFARQVHTKRITRPLRLHVENVHRHEPEHRVHPEPSEHHESHHVGPGVAHPSPGRIPHETRGKWDSLSGQHTGASVIKRSVKVPLHRTSAQN